jgi:hypothetical protein
MLFGSDEQATVQLRFQIRQAPSLYFQCQFEPEVILLTECFTASSSVPE